MVSPGAGFCGGTLFLFKPRLRQKEKGLRRKISGFSVQLTIATKQMEKRKVFGGVMVSPQNGDTRGGPPPPPSDATDCTAS